MNLASACMVCLIACGMSGCSYRSSNGTVLEGSKTVAAELPADLASDQIVQQMWARYRQCASYRASGTYTHQREKTVANSEAPSILEESRFATWFARETGHFRLDYHSADRAYTVLRNADGVQAIDSMGRGEGEKKDLMTALHHGNGVTSGTGLMIPCLFAPTEITHSSFWDRVGGLVRVADETVDGQPYFRLTGKYHFFNGTVDFWIDKNFVIHKIRSAYQANKDTLGVEIRTFEPLVDDPIPASEFDAAAIAVAQQGISERADQAR